MATITDEAKHALLLRIRNEFTSPRGQVLWLTAFKTHPEWADELQWHNQKKRDALYVYMGKIKKLIHKNGHSTKPQPDPVVPDKHTVLNSIVANYTRGDSVHFSEACRDHPDWAVAIGWQDPSKRATLYSIARNIRLRAKGLTVRNTVPKRRKTITEPDHEHQTGPSLQYCPQCGLNIKILSAAFTVALRHSQNHESSPA